MSLEITFPKVPLNSMLCDGWMDGWLRPQRIQQFKFSFSYSLSSKCCTFFRRPVYIHTHMVHRHQGVHMGGQRLHPNEVGTH